MWHIVHFSCYLPYAGMPYLVQNLKLVSHFHGFEQYTFQCQVLVVYSSACLLIALVVFYDINLWPRSELLVFRRKTYILSICFLSYILTSQKNVTQNSDRRSLASFLSDTHTFMSIITKSTIDPVKLLHEKHFPNFKHFSFFELTL